MESFLLVDDEEYVIEGITQWANIATDGAPDFAIMAVTDKESAMECIQEGEYSGLITDYHLHKGTSDELIKEAIKRGMGVIVYSSQRNLKGLQERFDGKKIDFRIRGDRDDFYVNLAIDLTIQCRLNRIKKAIKNKLHILKTDLVDHLSNIILSGITNEAPLVLEGPKGARKTYTAKKISEFLGCEPTVISPTKLGNLSSIKKNRMLVVEDYDLMHKFQKKRIETAIKNGIFVGVIYTCQSISETNLSTYSERRLRLLPLYCRKNDVPVISRMILGNRANDDFFYYVINNRLSIDDLELIKSKDDGQRDLIHIYNDVKKDTNNDTEHKNIVKRKASKHEKIKKMINQGVSLASIAETFNVGYQAIWKIKKEMINEQKK